MILFPVTTLQSAVQQVPCGNSPRDNVGSIVLAHFFEKSIESKCQLNTQLQQKKKKKPFVVFLNGQPLVILKIECISKVV